MLLSELHIEFASPVPVYEQIKKQVKHAIAKRILVENQPLPSIREMATFLKINPNTVARAYRELFQENVVDGRSGKGFWVKTADQLDQQKEAMVKEEFLKFLEKAVDMGFSQQRLKEVVLEFFSEGK